MKKLVFLFLCALFFISCQAQTHTIKISNGYIRGIREDESLVFKGIPYAQPPVGTMRFKPPQPMKNWKDTLSCENFTGIAAQGGNKGLSGGEDCLSLNVYTPVASAKAKLPVVVWVHGGSMTAGAGKGMNGHAFADRDSIVTITINYRLGVFGFLYLDDINPAYRNSGNNGLLDCLMALKWIRENISSLGGDPSKVTVMGESAGAKLVSALLVSPQARGYFHQMVLESGSVQCIRDQFTAKAIRQRLMDTLKVTRPEELLNLSTEKLIDAQNKVCGGAKGTNYFGPVEDGYTIPEDPYDYLEHHPNTSVKFLIGTNSAESKMFMGFDKRLYLPDRKVLEDWFGNNYNFVLSAEQKKGGNLNMTANTHILTEYMYQMHSYRLSNALAKNGNVIWMYRFDYSKDNTGASHAQELQYVWSTPSAHLSDQPDAQLGPQMHQAWVNFIKTGKPGKVNQQNWPLYQSNAKAIFVFDRVSHPETLKGIFNDKEYPSAGFVLN
ncbi:carboxylesterase/lipase family protein [Pedobacter sp. L105]|uniref:carboxylesterase/lipase family protein n=1 Tax=Pedobacter sp. L105 TaxID=1641871 RepID=UPI00131A7919|nr:carboxylesterase family protein [Pedobacter sp. L105]